MDSQQAAYDRLHDVGKQQCCHPLNALQQPGHSQQTKESAQDGASCTLAPARGQVSCSAGNLLASWRQGPTLRHFVGFHGLMSVPRLSQRIARVAEPPFTNIVQTVFSSLLAVHADGAWQARCIAKAAQRMATAKPSPVAHLACQAPASPLPSDGRRINRWCAGLGDCSVPRAAAERVRAWLLPRQRWRAMAGRARGERCRQSRVAYSRPPGRPFAANPTRYACRALVWAGAGRQLTCRDGEG